MSPTVAQPVASMHAALNIDGLVIRAEISPDTPHPTLTVWAQGETGHPGGDAELDADGVDALLAGLDHFRVQVEQLRAQLADTTTGSTR